MSRSTVTLEGKRSISLEWTQERVGREVQAEEDHSRSFDVKEVEK